jgi:ribulose-phosphate 3-epimerase
LQQLKAISEVKNHKPYIEVDGGVTLENYQMLLECGANVLVAGNTVFSSPNPTQTIQALKQ